MKYNYGKTKKFHQNIIGSLIFFMLTPTCNYIIYFLNGVR